MRIKKIDFINEITDPYNDSVDVGVEFKEGYSYTIVVRTPADLANEMLRENTNYVEPGTPMIIVKKLTEEIVNEAIQTYAKSEGYWLKLCQFGDELDIDMLNKLNTKYREEYNEN